MTFIGRLSIMVLLGAAEAYAGTIGYFGAVAPTLASFLSDSGATASEPCHTLRPVPAIPEDC